MKNKETLSESFFVENNIITLLGPIDDEVANLIIKQLLFLDYRFKTEGIPREQREITMFINSPGGSVTAGLAIYDTMNLVDADVRTVCMGMAASMGAFLLSSGTRGKREALPNSEVLIHQPLGGTQGQASDILNYAESIRRTREQLNTILSRNTDKPIETIRIDTDRDNRMTAYEARAYGLVDTVIDVTPKAYDIKKYETV